MGVWLEEIVTRRAQRKTREIHLQKASGKGLELESSECFLEDRIDAYEEFFLFLKATICSPDDMGKRFLQFSQARSMAMDLLGR